MKSDSTKLVFESLLHPKYHWRTIQGIAKQTQVKEDEVKENLELLILKKKVRKSYVPDAWGRDLFGLIDRVDLQRFKSPN